MSAIRVTPGRVVRSEWIKLTTLRSTVLMLAVAVIAMVGLSVVASLITVDDWPTMSEADRTRWQVSSRVLVGHGVAQLAIGVVGALAVGGEYSTGMMRATLAAVPRRLPVLWAKLGVLAAVTLVLMTIASFASFYAGTAILAAHWDFSLSDPGVLRAVLMTGVVVTAVGVLGTALGFILRNTAAAISALVGILMVLPVLAQFSPRVAQYLPSGVMTSLITPRMEANMVAPGPAFVLLCGYVAAAIAGAAIVLRRKDA